MKVTDCNCPLCRNDFCHFHSKCGKHASEERLVSTIEGNKKRLQVCEDHLGKSQKK